MMLTVTFYCIMLFVIIYGDDDHYSITYIRQKQLGCLVLKNQCILLSAIHGGGRPSYVDYVIYEFEERLQF